MGIALQDIWSLFGGIVLAALAGEVFLRAILNTASALNISTAVAGGTLAAFATSSPELTVSLVAALSGQPEIGLGDATGSNVVNIALIFGIVVLLGKVKSPHRYIAGDFKVALIVPIVTALMLIDGKLARYEGLILLAAFGVWLGVKMAATRQPRHQPVLAEFVTSQPRLSGLVVVLFFLVGLAGLVIAGRLFVKGALGIANAFAIDTYVFGAIIVAIGTSLPELVTAVLSRLRGHEDVGIATLIGSNIFNGLAIVGAATLIHPMTVRPSEVLLTLVCGLVALLFLIPNQSHHIPRWRGVALIALYIAFVVATFFQ